MRSTIIGLSMLAMAVPTAIAFGQTSEPTPPPTAPGAIPGFQALNAVPTSDTITITSGTYTVFHTTEGDFIARMLDNVAPATVENFVKLSSGQKSWRHPFTQLETTRPVYNNTQIYRIIPNAMIYGGDPLNRGEGDIGFQLPMEAADEVKFDRPGLLAMENIGTKSSGSRWFITLRPFPERSGNFTIFGEIAGGLDVVQRISMKPVKRPQVPLDPVLLVYVEVVKIPFRRQTTGRFIEENGVKVLRIDPNFVPISNGTTPPTPPAETSDSVSTSTETTTEAINTPPKSVTRTYNQSVPL